MTRRRPLTITLVTLFAFSTIASAMKPGDWTALGVIAPRAANSGTGTSSGYAPPLAGCYFIRTNLVNCVWTVTSAAPPWAQDQNSIGMAGIPLSYPSDQTGTWACIQCWQPGWVQVVATAGNVQDVAYYRLYRIEIQEDDAPQRYGIDPAYGQGMTGMLFPEIGGPERGGALKAWEMLEFDYRWHGIFHGQARDDTWPGVPIPGGWTPLSAGTGFLMPAPDSGLNSIVASTRDEQLVRVYLEGPRDPAPAGIGYDDGFEIALRMTRPYANATGEIRPQGIRSPGGVQIVTRFKPPSPYINEMQPGSPGKFHWPDPWGVEPTKPKLHVSRQQLVDVEIKSLQNKWMVHIPWRGMTRSQTYADIEVEARIPPRRAFGPPGNPIGGAQAKGVDPTGMEEGCMQLRWGTVAELKRIIVLPQYPDDWTMLKKNWVRRVSYEIKKINDRDANNMVPDPHAKVKPWDITLSFGAKTLVGGGPEREPDEPETDHAMFYVKQFEHDPDIAGQYYLWEVMANSIQGKLVANPVAPDLGELLTVAEVPPDVLNWVHDGVVIPPESICVKYRGYVGAIPNGPYGDKPGSTFFAADFDQEPKEVTTIDDPPAIDPREATFALNFINVRADVNNDGVLDVHDEDDKLEEGLTEEPGLLVTGVPHSEDIWTVDPPESDENLREIQLRFSIPVKAMNPQYDFDYTGYTVEIETDNENLHFWRNDLHQMPLERIGGGESWTWKVEDGLVPDDGSSVSIWVGSKYRGTTPETSTVQFFLVDNYGVRTSLDEIAITAQGWGMTVDLDENGTINDADEDHELDLSMDMRMIQDVEYDLRVWKHPNFSHYGRSSENIVTVTLKKSGPGRVSIVDDNGDTLFPAPPANEVTEVDITSSIDGDGYMTFKMIGHTPGSVTLRIELAVDEEIVADDVINLKVHGFDVTDVTFLGDHELTKWEGIDWAPAFPGVTEIPEAIRYNWIKDKQNDPAAYTKGTKPRLSVEFKIDPPLDRAYTVALRVRIGTTDYGLKNSIGCNKAELSDMNFEFTKALENKVKKITPTFSWAVAKPNTKTDAQKAWHAAGNSGAHTIYLTYDRPKDSPRIFEHKQGSSTKGLTRLFDKALEEACAIIDAEGANSDMHLALAEGLKSKLHLKSTVSLPSSKHPLLLFDTANYKAECADQAHLLRGLLRSIGLDGTVTYYFNGFTEPGGHGTTKTVLSLYEAPKEGRRGSSRWNEDKAEDSEPAFPHFTYHAVVKHNGSLYDQSYGKKYTENTLPMIETDDHRKDEDHADYEGSYGAKVVTKTDWRTDRDSTFKCDH